MTEIQYAEATLETIAEGAAITAFDVELKKAIENCMDINTDPKKARVVTLKMKIVPNDTRNRAGVEFEVTSKLISDVPGTDQLYLTDAGAFVPPMRQEELFNPVTGEVTRINGGEK
jgi:hypothetical protein